VEYVQQRLVLQHSLPEHGPPGEAHSVGRLVLDAELRVKFQRQKQEVIIRRGAARVVLASRVTHPVRVRWKHVVGGQRVPRYLASAPP